MLDTSIYLESLGGNVYFEYVGPNWVPMLVQERLPILKRISLVLLNYTKVTDAGVEHLKGLTMRQELFLDNTQVTDAGLEHLKGLTSLQTLTLNDTKVTDARMEHLKGLTTLQVLWLNDTQTTALGRESLRKALPNCVIYPEP